MIEKILERLEKRKDRWTDLANQSNFDGYAQEEKEYLLMANEDEKLIEIVQEVAKEYGEKKYYRIVLSCLEDSTSLEMPLTEQEYLFLTRLSDLVYKLATGCMPTMYVEQKGE